MSEYGVTFARGTRVEMEFDEEQFVGGGIYLFASIIERFLGSVCFVEQLQPACASVEAAEGGNPGMAAPSGTPTPAVITAVRYWDVTQALCEEPWTFHFFQAVRLLERMLPDRQPIGRFVHPSKEIVRINANPATAFPASQIQELRWETAARRSWSSTSWGCSGPWARCRSTTRELIRERLRAKDTTLGGVLQHVQPPHDFAVLSGVGEIPVHDRI